MCTRRDWRRRGIMHGKFIYFRFIHADHNLTSFFSSKMSPNVRDNIKSFLEMQQIPIHFESVHGRAKFSGD